MMGAIRHAAHVIWGSPARRGMVRGKLIDLALLGRVWVLFGAPFTGTIAIRALADTTAGRDCMPEALRNAVAGGTSVLALALPVAVAFAAFAMLYRVLPAVPTRCRDVWPGAPSAAMLFLAVYFTNFGSYDGVYGSLGGIISFPFFIYVAAIILLLGAGRTTFRGVPV